MGFLPVGRIRSLICLQRVNCKHSNILWEFWERGGTDGKSEED
jgi:hypothetical protein